MRLRAVLAGCAIALALPGGAKAAECRRVVLFALPGITWSDVDRVRPPNLLEAVDRGAAGSVAVRTILPRTSYASGFATLGAGARIEAGTSARGKPAEPSRLEGDAGFVDDVRAPGIAETRSLAGDAGYGARAGALASALPFDVVAIGNSDLGSPPAAPFGFGRWSLLTAMDAAGTVSSSRTDAGLLVGGAGDPFGVATDVDTASALVIEALQEPCVVLVVDPGDLARADTQSAIDGTAASGGRAAALVRADALLGQVTQALDPANDLLLIVSPTSPAGAPEAHLGVAVAVGPTFEAGATLQSASTRRSGIVTLPDVAPTILEAFDIEQPPEMNGRPWISVEAPDAPMQDALALDAETVFVDRIDNSLSTAYVIVQVLVYLVGVPLLMRRRRAATQLIDVAALATMAFPLATYILGIAPADKLGTFGYIATLLAIDAAVVAIGMAVARRPLDRVLWVTGLTTAVLVADVMTGARLQLNTVFGYSPIIAGRFAGIGNVAYAVMGIAAVLTVALLAQRTDDQRGLAAGALIFALVIIVDGAPQFGSDVGGVLSLVPAFGLTLLLLSGRRPRAGTIAALGVGALCLLALFVWVDVSRPADSQTHLARTWSDVTERGWSSLVDVVERKARANVRVFTSTIWTYLVPPALAALGFLLMKPTGRWRELAETHPKLRAGLIGGLALGVLGFAVNDSGIVIPAVALSFLVPLAIVVHVSAPEPESPT